MKALIIFMSIIISGCSYQVPDQEEKANRKFQNCLYYASPASGEAIKACREAAWPNK